jgi:hypothetical protein
LHPETAAVIDIAIVAHIKSLAMFLIFNTPRFLEPVQVLIFSGFFCDDLSPSANAARLKNIREER